jgi:hypothetical protein
MNLTDAGGGESSSGGGAVWYQASIHVKGLRAPTAEGER